MVRQRDQDIQGGKMSVTNNPIDILKWRQTVCLTLNPDVVQHIDHLRGNINRSRYIEQILIMHIQDMEQLDQEENDN